jgi:hypothetical protein
LKGLRRSGNLSVMRRIALIAVLTALSATPALAQNFEGNWGCRDATTAKAGILTIYGSVYGFASTAVGDAASGTGTITGYQDGVGFNDGGLKTARAIQAGRVIPDPNYGVAIQLETADAIVMLCTPRG